jgi:pimeloyl-ACP methyl ester carboxylesterase
MIQKFLIVVFAVVSFLFGCETAEQTGFRDGFAPVENGHLYYQIAGSGDAVVLIHGNAGDHRHWDNQFERQSADPVIGSPYSNFSDLAALLDHLDVESAHIVGWSMGSGIAFDFVTAYPDRARSLVSVGPWVFGHRTEAISKTFEQAGAVVEAASEGGAEAGANAFVDYILADTVIDESADKFIRAVGSASSFWTWTNPNQELSLKPNAASQLSSLTIPILVVTAEHDLPACHDMADFIISEAQNAHRTVLADTGHLMHIEKPDEFNAKVVEFLAAPR